MGTAIKHPIKMPDRVKPSVIIFDIRALWHSARESECPDVKNYKWWNRMLYSRTHMATVGVKGLRWCCLNTSTHSSIIRELHSEVLCVIAQFDWMLNWQTSNFLPNTSRWTYSKTFTGWSRCVVLELAPASPTLSSTVADAIIRFTKLHTKSPPHT